MAAATTKKEKKTAEAPSPADITFTIATLPRFSITVRGAVQELEKYSEDTINTLLPAPAPRELALKLCRYGCKERVCRICLPEDNAAADAVKELTAVDRWSIRDARDAPTTLVASYQGLYLPAPVAPLVLEACAPTPPLASADTMAAALQPHVVDRVLRWAIASPLGAARAALASRFWAAGVREWMLTPRVETVKTRSWSGAELKEEQQWTGLPRALRLTDVLTTPADAAAAVALLRAAVRPAPAVAAQLAEAYKEGIMDDSMSFMGVPPYERTHTLNIRVAKLTGLPGVTFVFRVYCTYIDCGQAVNALYVLEGNDRSFRHLLSYTSGEMETETDIHLPRFLALRARLRAAFPALAPVSDAALLAILAQVVGATSPPTVAGAFALVRFVPGHPERGDGQPQTAAEQKEARWGKVPKDVGKGGREPGPRSYCNGMMPFGGVRGMAVPLLDSTRVRPAVDRAIALIDAFHHGGGGH